MASIPDPAAGMERMKELTRKLLAVPKSEVAKRSAKTKGKREKKG